MAIKYPDRGTLYDENLDRIKKVIAFEKVDRIPVAYVATGFSPNYFGYTLAEFVKSPKLQVKVLFDAMEKLRNFGHVDAINLAPMGVTDWKFFLGSAWFNKVKLPGDELPDNVIWQVMEEELITVEDYDVILDKGWDEFKKRFIKERLGYSTLAQLKIMGPILLNASRDAKGHKKAGYVLVNGGSIVHPFDTLSGGRSMTKFILDLHRYPDKVEAVMDMILPEAIKAGIDGAGLVKPTGIWVPGWRTASGMLSPKIWDRFVLPYYVKMVEATVEAGLTPLLHFDQDWTRDLEKLKAFPAKKCLLNIDGMTDIRKAKEVLDGHIAIMGDVPAALFAAGTPEDMHNYVRDLMRDIGPTGFILAPGCDAPYNTKPENMEAYIEAAAKYGKM